MTSKYCTTPIEPFLQIIRSFSSPNPSALPQRSNFEVRDEDFESRNINRELYKVAKDEFVKAHLSLSADTEYSGIYFFFNRNNKTYPFFYIGKADNLFQRLTKHFITFDYIIYAAAFPNNYDKCYSDCIRFYAKGKYPKKRALYKRQFESFKLSSFKEIGWISFPEFADPELLKTVESNAIFFFKPLANGTKGSMNGDNRSKVLFEHVKSIVDKEFI